MPSAGVALHAKWNSVKILVSKGVVQPASQYTANSLDSGAVPNLCTIPIPPTADLLFPVGWPYPPPPHPPTPCRGPRATCSLGGGVASY